MGKHNGKDKSPSGEKSAESKWKHVRDSVSSPRAPDEDTRGYDKDVVVFIRMSQALKDEGNRLFQKRDYEGAFIKYERAIKLLPRNHIDVSHLRSNMAACYMQLGISEYPKAIHECNLALEVTPKYSKALLKRARCYEALNRLDLALRDVETVLKVERNNLMATEIAERVRKTIDRQGSGVGEVVKDLVPLPEVIEPPPSLTKIKSRKKKSKNIEERRVADNIEEKKDEKESNGNYMEGKIEEQKPDSGVTLRKSEDQIEEKKTEDKLVVEEEKITTGTQEGLRRTVKLVCGEDIRWAQIPLNCNVFKLREIISDRFPGLKAILVKYRDPEGDLVTITTTEELRWAEASVEHGCVKLYIFGVHPDQDPVFQKLKKEKLETKQICLSDWIIQFAQIFKNYLGFDIDTYIDIHEIGMKLYSEAMEETVTSEEAQDIFSSAADKFQEMAALALFNWGNVHMSRARKGVYFTEDSSKESVLEKVKSAFDWAQKEYMNAGTLYDEALRIKPDLYEAVLALGQQQFEQAKLSWYYAVATRVNLESWPSDEVLELYNCAEENMERGMQMWKETEEQRLNELSKPKRSAILLQEMKLDNLFKNISAYEAAEQASNTRSQIYVLWGTMLYERSLMEFKLGIPVWHECLEVAVEKFELAGASPTDIAVMMKNHCSNDTAFEGLGFNIDEIVQAWNEMYEAKQWQSCNSSFRLEPLLRRRVSKLYYALEHA